MRTIHWLPSTCAYRLVAEGHDLYWWHRLVSGSSETVHEAGISMRGRVTASEAELAEPEDYFEHVLDEEPVAPRRHAARRPLHRPKRPSQNCEQACQMNRK